MKMAAGVRRGWLPLRCLRKRLPLWLAWGVHGNSHPHPLQYRLQIRARYGLRQIVLSKWCGGFLVKINWRGIIEWVGCKRLSEVFQTAGVRRNIKRL